MVRAWDRLRVSGASITPEEATAARAARAQVGHALRDARYRRDHDADKYGFYLDDEAAASLRRRRFRAPRMAAAVAVTLAVVLLAVWLYRPGAPGGSPAAQPQPQPSDAPSDILGGSRGRISGTLPPFVITPSTPVPSPASPAPTGEPGSGSGTGTGDPFGALPPRADQDYRIVFVVRDATTFQPIEGACIVHATECDRGKLTNKDGIAYFDFQLQGIAPKWDFDFLMGGYARERREVTYAPDKPMPRIDVFLGRSQ